MLRDLAEQLDTGAFDMELTGFDALALEELMTAAPPAHGENDPLAEWQGMPEFSQTEIMGGAIVCIVRFREEKDRSEFEKLLGWTLSHKGKLYSTWFPQPDFDQLGNGIRYVES